MSVTVTQELTQQTVTVTGNPVENNVTVTVSNARGASGAAGPNSVTSATTSDSTADLSISNVTTATATVSGTLTASHIHGNLAGSVYAHVRAGEALLKGDPVYVSGFHNGTSTAEVSKADASNAAKMPAVGIMDANLAHNATGHMVITGTITELATNAYSINAELYVAAGGGMTATPPTARAQPVARVERSNANNGAIIVKVDELSASEPTASTLVRRDATGGADFAGTVNLNIGVISDLRFEDYQAANGATFIYNGTSASDHRIALGLGTTDAVTFGNGTFATGSIATSQPLTLTQTWTTTATYTGMRVNVTDSGPSSAASLLMDLQVGGESKFKVAKNGSTAIGSGLIPLLSVNDTQVDLYGLQVTDKGLIWGCGNSSSTAIGTWPIGGVGVRFGNLGTLAWGNAAANSQTLDLFLMRDSAAVLAQRNSTNAQVTRIYDTYTSTTDYHRLAIATARATATAMSGASVTLTDIIPAGAVVVGVTCKVTTAITGATSFQLGTATDSDRFGAAIAITLGATSDNRNWTSGTVECFPSATSLVLTANGSNFTAGAVYVSVQYLSGQSD